MTSTQSALLIRYKNTASHHHLHAATLSELTNEKFVAAAQKVLIPAVVDMIKKFMKEKKSNEDSLDSLDSVESGGSDSTPTDKRTGGLRVNSLGIDVGKKKCRAALKDERGDIIREFFFSNNNEGISALIQSASHYGKCSAVLESTGNMWIRIHDGINAISLQNKNNCRIQRHNRVRTGKRHTRRHLLVRCHKFICFAGNQV